MDKVITVSNLSLSFNGTPLYKDVDLKFTEGNCYGVIGANGAGKSTFLKILSGELDSTTGEVAIKKDTRMSVLKQDHFAFDEYTVLDTVIMGNKKLYDIMKEKDELYAKGEMTDEEGIRVCELEAEFAELGGWEAESDASKLIQGLGLDDSVLYTQMSYLTGNEKVKVLLAQALFGNPDIILLDEPTNNLDVDAISWLEDFLLDYEGTVIVVSHDRHFLNTVCTHIVDIDYGKVKMYVGNYEFWYESSQLIQQMIKQQNKKAEEKIKELQSFIARFSANKSKSKQATSRKMPASSRRYPWVGFNMDREPGKEILEVEGVSKTIDGEKLLNNVTFRVERGDKVAFLCENENAVSALFDIIMEKTEPDEGTFKWGSTITTSYFPKDNSEFFDGCDKTILEWLSQYNESNDRTETYLRGFLGKMLFSGEDVFKPVNVLSGGERVRCMLSRMMLFGSNALVLDQPTNHLDLESITAVNNGLCSFKGIVLFASHDHEFIQTVANRIIVIEQNGIKDITSSYDEYIEANKSSK